MSEDEQNFKFEMTCLIPGKEPKTVVFRTKDWHHFLQVVKRVEDALMDEEDYSSEVNIKPARKALINKVARKMALQMIKDGAFQTTLFDTE